MTFMADVQASSGTKRVIVSVFHIHAEAEVGTVKLWLIVLHRSPVLLR